MNFILQILISTLAVLTTGALLPGVEVKDPFSGIIVALVLAFLNSFLKPLMVIFTLPITVASLGLFLIVINACLIMMADGLIGEGFEVDSFWWAIIFSFVLSIITSIFESIKNRTPGGGNEE